jgi:UDP-N-acetylglucosamine 2-epimerase
MILIADSGSTKTDWAFVENGEIIEQKVTPGINPVHMSETEIREILTIDSSLFTPFPSDARLPVAFHSSLPYLEFGYLTSHALGVITDSGNVAEEATFNHVPCITLNSYTEHIETVKVGTNVLVGEDAELLGKQVAEMVSGNWKHGELPDRWDGRTAERILQILDNG